MSPNHSASESVGNLRQQQDVLLPLSVAARMPPLRCWLPPRADLPAPRLDWEIIRHDGDSLWIAKPGQLQVHPSKPTDPCTLWDLLVRYFAWEWIVDGAQVSILTRLDRETSGVVLIALSRVQARKLGRIIERHQLGKEYLALVHGWPQQDSWRVDAPLIARRLIDEHAPIGVEQVVDSRGKEARTDFAVKQRFEKKINGCVRRFALLRVRPAHGRMHQIRIHAAHAGHALVGDKIYGQPASTYLRWIDEGWTPEFAQRLIVSRQFLHCCALTLEGERVESPLPADMRQFLESAARPQG